MNKVVEQIVIFLLTLTVLVKCAPTNKYYQNPVLPQRNSPDPGVILHDGIYYAVTTSNLNTEKGAFPIHMSKDLVNWSYVSDVFPESHKPKWASQDFWAPELHIINGDFRVYFTARDRESDILCIGVGVSDKIVGPYVDIGHPLVKNMSVGSIDATVMKIDRENYLVWKDDGNDPKFHLPTWIWAQQLTESGLGLIGPKYALIRNTLSWEGPLVEAPWVIYHNSTYYLFYSANGYCDASYSVGVARSKHPLGPYEKYPSPILKSNEVWIGPGHCSVVPEASDMMSFVMVYHSWHYDQVCGANNRLLMIDRVNWSKDGWPYIETNSPSIKPQPYPF